VIQIPSLDKRDPYTKLIRDEMVNYDTPPFRPIAEDKPLQYDYSDGRLSGSISMPHEDMLEK
jgi:hypothetical protein